MVSRVRISDEQRRARLVVRHHLGRTAADAPDAVRALVAVHSSDPATPYLGSWARVPGFATDRLDRALYQDRSLWRLHAMRRTLFVVPTDRAPVFAAAAADEIAARERRRVEAWLAAEMDPARVAGWLREVEARTLEVLADGEWRTQELTAAVPELGTEITAGSGKWSTRVPLSSRVLYLMAMDGRVVRGRPAGTWRSSQYRWAAASAWFSRLCPPVPEDTARAELVRCYLHAYGPATLADLRWWTGWTAKQVTAALQRVDTAAVALDSGEEGLMLADDAELPAAEAWTVALLPALDSTPMGWKDRRWYLGDHGDRLYDRNGNAGPTVWLRGRVVGGWGHRADGEVVYRLLEDVGREASERVAEEAAALGEWLGGVVVTPRFRTPLERALVS